MVSKIKIKDIILVIETVVIIILLSLLIQEHYSAKKYPNVSGTQLLSPRIYSGILQPQSYLILNFKPLQQEIQDYIGQRNLNISVYVLNMRDGASFGIGENEEFEPASLGKLPLAMLILQKVEDKKLSLDTQLEIKDKNRDSSSGNLYQSPVSKLSIKELLYYLLSESDNTAARTLSEQVTMSDLKNLSLYLDYYNKNKDSNKTEYKITPKSTGNLFLSLYLSTALQPKDSEFILSMLANSSFNIKNYTNIPNDVTIAQKYGVFILNNKRVFHDCGILYIEDSRIFYCLMSRDLDQESASRIMGELLSKIYNYIIEAKKTTI